MSPFMLQTIPPREAHLLNDCFLKYMTEEEVYATVGFDMENDGDELLKMFHQGMFRKDSPQLALWDCEKQRVSFGVFYTTQFFNLQSMAYRSDFL